MTHTLTGREWYAVFTELEACYHSVTANWLFRRLMEANPNFSHSDADVTIEIPTYPMTRYGRITGVIYRIHGSEKARPDDHRGIEIDDLIARSRASRGDRSAIGKDSRMVTERSRTPPNRSTTR